LTTRNRALTLRQAALRPRIAAEEFDGDALPAERTVRLSRLRCSRAWGIDRHPREDRFLLTLSVLRRVLPLLLLLVAVLLVAFLLLALLLVGLLGLLALGRLLRLRLGRGRLGRLRARADVGEVDLLLLVVDELAVDDRVLDEGLVVEDVAVGDDGVAVLADLERADAVIDAEHARRDDRHRLERGLVGEPAAHGEAGLDRQ